MSDLERKRIPNGLCGTAQIAILGRATVPRAQSFQVESIALYNFLMEHDLFGRPVSIFPDHALADLRGAASNEG